MEFLTYLTHLHPAWTLSIIFGFSVILTFVLVIAPIAILFVLDTNAPAAEGNNNDSSSDGGVAACAAACVACI